LRGLQRADPVLDLLAYAPWNQPPDRQAAERIRHDMAELWGVQLRHVSVAPSCPVPDRQDSLWHGYLRPMTSLHHQPSYARLNGAGPALALRAALAGSAPQRLFVHRLTAMSALFSLGLRHAPAPLLDLDDIEHRAFERLIAMPPHWRAKRLLRGWLPALRHGEARALRASALALVCSESDRQYLDRLWQLPQLAVLPNALPVPTPSPLPQAKTALFLGMHSYEPNRVGAEYLVHEVWPLVHARHPDATLVVAGKACERVRGHDAPPPGVRFEGFVPDLQALYARTRVVCCPILSGGGTRIKIIEGAMQARPIVSTPIGAEGLDFDPGRGEITLADTPSAFADGLNALFDDRPAGIAQEMGRRARDQAVGRYGEERVLNIFLGLLKP